MGIDHRRIFSLAMGVAMIVATIAALYLGMRANFDPTIGPARLLYAFEAVIIGGLGSFWGTLAGGIIIGARADDRRRASIPNGRSWPGISRFSLFWCCGRAACSRAHRIEPPMAGTVSPDTGSYRLAVTGRLSIGLAAGSLVLIGVLAVLPAFATRDLIQDLIFVFYMLALAQCWNLLAGYAGLVSVGQQAFVGLGGYLLFALTIFGGLDPLLAIPLAGVTAALFAIPTGLVVFRFRGAYFAIGTWVVAEVYRLVFAQFKQLGGGTGTSLPPFVTNEIAGIEWVKALFDVRTPAARDIISYWIALALAAGTIAAVYLVLRSRRGLALFAIRDQETTAESVGVDNVRTKLGVYVLTAAATGMIGALIYLQKARISPDAAFAVLDWTAYVILIVVIGGIGTIEGPVIGVVVFYLLQRYLADFGTWYLILLGVIAITIMLFAPNGIWGYVNQRFGLVLFPTRRRLVRS